MITATDVLSILSNQIQPIGVVDGYIILKIDKEEKKFKPLFDSADSCLRKFLTMFKVSPKDALAWLEKVSEKSSENN